MRKDRLWIGVLCFMAVASGCNRISDTSQRFACQLENGHDLGASEAAFGKGGLLLPAFKTFEQFREVVDVTYSDGVRMGSRGLYAGPTARLTYCSGGYRISSVLRTGISQLDIMEAKSGGFWDRLNLGLKSPYTIMKSADLLRVQFLSRRRPKLFGPGDVAFYDLAETMTYVKMSDVDLQNTLSENLSEKGYINTFNHITAQAFMTTLFSEKLADFIADVHERYNMPELVSGDFTEVQLVDLDNGAVDNYVDMINNEWGQELGKELVERFNITRQTTWSPELLASYLNRILVHNSWAFDISFEPFRPDEEIVIKFSRKLNIVMSDARTLRKFYE